MSGNTISKTCKNCSLFKGQGDDESDILIGYCKKVNNEIKTMKIDEIGIYSGHDGPIMVGADFGCIHFKNKNIKEL